MNKFSERAKNERDFFDRLATKHDLHYFWGWKTKVGQYRHDRRAELITQYVKLNRKIKVLELGCFVGELTHKLASSGAKIYGIDISAKAIALAKDRFKLKNIFFSVDNIEKSRLKSNFFDAVTGNGILHHIDLDCGLLEIKRLLKKGGQVIFFEPNLLNPEIFLERKVSFFRKISNSSPDETAFIRWSLKRKVEAAGFVKVKVEPFDFMYPAFPSYFIPVLKIIDSVLVKLPLIREFSGSLIVTGEKS